MEVILLADIEKLGKAGDVVNLRIIRIESDRRRIGLSMRKVDSAAYVDKDMKALAQALETEAPAEEETEAEAAEEN